MRVCGLDRDRCRLVSLEGKAVNAGVLEQALLDAVIHGSARAKVVLDRWIDGGRRLEVSTLETGRTTCSPSFSSSPATGSDS